MNESSEGNANSLAQAPAAASTTPEANATAAAPVQPANSAAPTIKPKKKKTGIIIGSIIGALAVAGGVFAILFFFVFNKGGDPMTDAMVKLLNGDNRNVSVSGTFSFDTMEIPLEVNFTAQYDSVAKAGLATADLSGSFSDMSINANVQAVMTGDENAYIKISGIKDMFTNMLSAAGISCTGSECDTYLDLMASSLDTSDSTGGMLGTLLQLDEKWVKLDNASLSSSMTLPAGIDISSISNHKSELIEAYKKNPFITTTTDGVNITKKNDTVYKLGFDYEKMANFSNEVAKIYGAESNVTASQLEESYKNAGTAYAEIDGNHNITRLYIELPGATAQDLTISYPEALSIAAPDDYTTSEVINSLFQNLGGFNFGNSNGYIQDCGDDCVIYDDDDDYDYDYDDDYDYDYDDDDLDIDLDDLDFDWDWDEEE